MNPAEYEAMYRLEDRLWWYTGMRRITAAALGKRLSGAAGPLRILDAGCGTGGNLAWLTRVWGRAWGVDLSPLATAYCRRRGLTRVSRASVLELPFAEGTFDLVTSFDVIYHLGVADDVAALREMRRVLRPGGALFVRVPALERLQSHHDVAVHTRQRYRAAELRRKAEAAGLRVERASYANTVLLPLAAVSRLGGRLRSALAGPGPMGPKGGGEVVRSDVRPAPALLNTLFGAVLGLEAVLLTRIDLPIGLSALVVARRPG
ncbi:MAG TPA: class I SAM-dependent methyltransferase [Chloroflexota bacterium]|nr:class I SAM-dependent methyltransferase [Chloroflexota bacterium]